MRITGTRWATIRVALVLLYLGALPLAPDPSALFAVTLLAVATVTAIAVLRRRVGTASAHAPSPRQSVASSTAEPAPLQRPAAPGTRGTARSRAPSRPVAARG